MKTLVCSSAEVIPLQGSEGQFAEALQQSISGKGLEAPAN